MEIPDAIGWTKLKRRDQGLVSYLIECKLGRKDFRDNLKKDTTVGHFRYFLAPKGLLHPRDMYDGWGLLEFDGNTIRLVKQAAARDHHGQERENYMLMCVLRRSVLALRYIRGVCEKQPLSVTFTRHFDGGVWEEDDVILGGSAIGSEDEL